MIKKLSHIPIEWIAFLFLMLSFFLPIKVNSLSTLILGIVTLYAFIRKKLHFNGYSRWWFFTALFLVLLIGLLYTNNLNSGFSTIEKSLSLLFAPFLTIHITQFNTKQKRGLMDSFIIMGWLTSMYCIGVATLHYINTGSVYSATQKGHFVYNHFIGQLLTAPVKIHAIYYAMYVSFVNLYLLNSLIDKKITLSKKRKVTYIFLFLFFCTFLVLLKSAMFSFIFPNACLILIVVKFRKVILQSTKLKVLLFTSVLIATLFMYQGIKTKIESFSFHYSLSDDHLTPLTMRLAMWECAWEVISEHWLLGTGTGDAQDELQKMYHKKRFKIGIEDNFNVHNMYLQYGLSNGIFMCLLFITTLIILFRKAIKHQNMVFFSLLLLFTFFSITESTMLRQNGIVFFVFLSSMFYWDPTLWNLSCEEE